MIPTNKDNDSGCSPISSNCIIWQGPAIDCIKLCKGDSISDVTARLADELCIIMGYLDITTYDLKCFNPVCPELENFHDLIQLIITKLCDLQDCCETHTGESNIVLKTGEKVLTNNTVVTISSCFHFINETGDTITTMTIEDYAKAIGTRVCSILIDITELKNRTTSLETRVTIIENTCCNEDEFQLPLISSCVLGSNPNGWPVLSVLAALETAFCELKSATGTPQSLFLSIAKQCSNLDGQQSLAFPGTNMGSLSGWVTQGNYNNLASSINNMWLTICDLRAAVFSLSDCCQPTCREIQLNLSASISAGNLEIFLTGIIPVGFSDCTGLGSLVTIQDSAGNIYSTYIQLPSKINQPPTVIVLSSTPLNPVLDFTITLNSCLINNTDNITCERVVVFLLVNSIACPAITLTPTGTTIAYTFNNILVAPVTYVIALLDSLGITVLQENTHVDPVVFPAGSVSSLFAGLSLSTTYIVRISVTYAEVTKICPLTTVTTDA